MPFISDRPQSGLCSVNLSKFCKQGNDKKDSIEEDEKAPIRPTQVEPAQWNDDEGQNQRQTQRSHQNPRQQTLVFKLEEKRTNDASGSRFPIYTVFLCKDQSVFEKFTCTSEFVLSICTRHPKPTPSSMSEGNWVKGDVNSYRFVHDFYRLFYIKDTENDASKTGRYCHPWVTLPSDGDIRKAIWKRDINNCMNYYKNTIVCFIISIFLRISHVPPMLLPQANRVSPRTVLLKPSTTPSMWRRPTASEAAALINTALTTNPITAKSWIWQKQTRLSSPHELEWQILLNDKRLSCFVETCYKYDV